MTEVVNRLKAKGPCECGVDACTLYGTLGKPDKQGRRHVRGCKAFGCHVCLGRANRRKGDDKARVARKRMGLGGPASRHEELFGGPIRVEIKAGAQVGPLTTRFLAAEAQSEAARSLGDHRPFAFVAMPEHMSDGIVAMRLSVWCELVAPLLEAAS